MKGQLTVFSIFLTAVAAGTTLLLSCHPSTGPGDNCTRSYYYPMAVGDVWRYEVAWEVGWDNWVEVDSVTAFELVGGKWAYTVQTHGDRGDTTRYISVSNSCNPEYYNSCGCNGHWAPYAIFDNSGIGLVASSHSVADSMRVVDSTGNLVTIHRLQTEVLYNYAPAKVSVPAGNFTALSQVDSIIESFDYPGIGFANGRDSVMVDEKCFAPNIGVVLQRVNGKVRELQSYHLH